MTIEQLGASIALTLGVVCGALHYLRGVTRRVLVDLCGDEGGDAGADFWLRAADVLAIAGSLVLVLTFGDVAPDRDWVDQLRLVLGLALAGQFITVVIVASSIWRFVPTPEGPASASPAGHAPRVSP